MLFRVNSETQADPAFQFSVCALVAAGETASPVCSSRGLLLPPRETNTDCSDRYGLIATLAQIGACDLANNLDPGLNQVVCDERE